MKPNQHSKPGVHSVHDCLYTMYSIQRYSNIAIVVRCTGKKGRAQLLTKAYCTQCTGLPVHSVQCSKSANITICVQCTGKKDRTYLIPKAWCTQCTGLPIHSVQHSKICKHCFWCTVYREKSLRLIITQSLVYAVYKITRKQHTVFIIFKTCSWCTVYRRKKMEPNQHPKLGVHSVHDCLYTAYSKWQSLNINQSLLYEVYRTFRTQRTVLKIYKHYYWCTVYREKKEPT